MVSIIPKLIDKLTNPARLKPGEIMCDNCYSIIPANATRCPKCTRDVIPDYMLKAQTDMEQSYKERGLQDSLAIVRPLIHAISAAIQERAPMMAPIIQTQVTEANVFELLCELERRGFRLVPCEPVAK